MPRALVAQGIERLPPEQKAAGSNPVKGTREIHRARPCAWPFLFLRARRRVKAPGRVPAYSMSAKISPGSSPASRNFLRVTKFHTITTNVAPIFTTR